MTYLLAIHYHINILKIFEFILKEEQRNFQLQHIYTFYC